MAMEGFAESFNKLQSVMNTVGQDIEFPQIVVIGSQSDGKSSVLESVVQNGFLPRGAGVVTRTPIILQLRHVPYNGSEEGSGEYAEISYDTSRPMEQGTKSPKRIDNIAQVAAEIQAATEKLTGSKNNIVNSPITVTLYSPKVADLTLVDLPGLVEVAAVGQPHDIKDQVESLIVQYIENKRAIILAVHNGSSDIANSKSLSLARQVDPDGHRTLCILTKLDLVDPSIDLTKRLNGQELAEHNLKVLRVIGVINRSKNEAAEGNFASAEEQQRKEQAFFQGRYKKVSKQHGTKVLVDHLKLLFGDHIRKSIPELKKSVDEQLSSVQEELATMGESVCYDPSAATPSPNREHALVVKVIKIFCKHFMGSIEGTVDNSAKALRGGARIERVFNRTYWDALGAIIPLENIDPYDVWTEIHNSWGVETEILSIKAFKLMVKKEMQRMEQLSIDCVKLAHQEMLTISSSAAEQIQDIQIQFPKLAEEINHIVAKFLDFKLSETKAMVTHCVLMQLDYINIKHPEFVAARYDALIQFKQIAELAEKAKSNGRPIITTGENMDETVSLPPSQQPRLSADEEIECRITIDLVRKYFDFIRCIVRDSVPKVIMRFLVNKVKDNIEAELLTKLEGRENYGPLLRESETTQRKRKALEEKLEGFHQAEKLVRELGTA